MNWNELCAILLIVVIVSFLGFCVENIWLIMTKGFMDNRNMHLPFLLGYGLAIVGAFAIFGTPQNMRFFHIPIELESQLLQTGLYYLAMCGCVMAGEVVLGTYVEKAYGIIWWDYTKLPLHITRYTSIPTTLAFASLITLFEGLFFVPLFDGFAAIQSTRVTIVACGMMVLLVRDFVKSANQMAETSAFVEVWKIDLSNSRLHQFWQTKVLKA